MQKSFEHRVQKRNQQDTNQDKKNNSSEANQVEI